MTKAADNMDDLPPAEPLPTSPEELFAHFDSIGIIYENFHHEPIFTVAEGEHLKKNIPGLHCRNLFLRDKKGTMFLVVAANETPVDLKKLQGMLDCGRLSFGSPDRLWRVLGIRPGSVSPFTVINDTDHQVQVILDKIMMEAALVNYHPLDNARTTGLTPQDLLKFFDSTGHRPVIMDLAPAAPD